jgi:hypothetical protein
VTGDGCGTFQSLPPTAIGKRLNAPFGWCTGNSQHGTVHSVALINDRETGRPRGFGFIEMDDDAISGAIQALDGKELGGRADPMQNPIHHAFITDTTPRSHHSFAGLRNLSR